MINGIIVQKMSDDGYCGVDGKNWFLNDMYLEMCDYFDEKIDISWNDDDYVDVCNDISYIKKYIALSQINGIRFRLIMCETGRKRPELASTNILLYRKFIGYDYAYAGGSYYSAVKNDLFLRKIEDFKKIELNEYGLIRTEEDVKAFIELRRCKEDVSIEKGDFIVYKLFEVDLIR